MRVSGVLLTALMVLGLATGVAQAYTVTHSTLGTLFSDDLEGPYFQAEVGSWGTTNDGTNLLAFTKMQSGGTWGPTAAADGSDYLEMSRDLTKARWQEAILTQPVSSGTLDIEFQYWINDPWPQIVTLDNAIGTSPGSTGMVTAILNSGTLGGSNWWDASNGGVNTGVPISEGQWNLFQMHVDLDNNNYQITVTPSSTGVPVAGNVVSTTPGQTVSRIGYQFHHTAPNPLPVYLDAAPGTPGPVVNPDIDTLLCSDDTYIENTSPDANFGDADSVVIKAWGAGPNRKAYVKWDLSSVTEPVTSARVQLQNQWDSLNLVGQAVDVYLLNDGDVGEGWNETALTWNNAPANVITSGVDFDEASSTLLGQVSMLEPVRSGNLYTMASQELIDAINNDTDGSMTLMFAIVNQGPTGMTFASKEDTDGNPTNRWTVPFEGASLVLNDPADVIPVIIPGDADLNGIVDDADAAILASNWQMQSGAVWADGDFNGDERVDDIDATLLATNWTSSTTATVPEPGTITLLLSVIGSLFLAFYRRKR